MLYGNCAGTVSFFAHYSQDIQEIFLLESLYALTILLMEVSSGYLADHFGMVVELRLGGVFWPAAWLLDCYGWLDTAGATRAQHRQVKRC